MSRIAVNSATYLIEYCRSSLSRTGSVITPGVTVPWVYDELVVVRGAPEFSDAAVVPGGVVSKVIDGEFGETAPILEAAGSAAIVVVTAGVTTLLPGKPVSVGLKP